MGLSAVTSFAELELVQSFWVSAQHHPNIDFDLFNLVCRTRPHVLRPHIVVLGSPQQPKGLLVGRLERGMFSPRIGYFTPLRVPARVLQVVYQAAIGDIAKDEATALV